MTAAGPQSGGLPAPTAGKSRYNPEIPAFFSCRLRGGRDWARGGVV